MARLVPVLLSAALVMSTVVACAASPAVQAPNRKSVAFSFKTGSYGVSFSAARGSITIRQSGQSSGITILEIPGSKRLDLLSSVQSVKRSGSTYSLRGSSSWASFTFNLSRFPQTPGLLHLQLTLSLRKAPPDGKFTGDIQVEPKSKATFSAYAPAPPIAGTSVMVSSTALHTTMLYLADLTRSGQFFDRTGGGVTHGVFAYPNAGAQGALVGLVNKKSFGYPVSSSDIGSLPHGKATTIVSSYLYLTPGVPATEASIADTYLKLLGTVYDALPKPSIPPANWADLAGAEASQLADQANLVTVAGQQYLRSYVSDTRSAPELITQATVLAGVKAYEARYHVSVPIDSILEKGLSNFYDPQYQSIVNGLGHDPQARGESWYFVTNMISLLQLAQEGDETARKLLLDSADAVMQLAHVNGYEFPQNFSYATWNGSGTGVQADVTGGYAWLMLGLYDLTKQAEYLSEAKAAITHVEGKGFNLSYETHMTAYAAAAAQRLFVLTGDARYHGDALLALANLFHATRLWDCTYGTCKKGTGYHTFMGLNPLPWSNYIAMLEQYEAWLGLQDYMTYASAEPAYVKDLVQGFLQFTPLTMQYALPPRLPAGAATKAPGEYPFVPSNNLGWNIPLEDLRTGEQTNGLIGQEIYGAGGPFMFAAYAP